MSDMTRSLVSLWGAGQTGSGKTYTMGSSWAADMENQGVIPSVMDEMFSRIDAATNTDFTVKVSFVEIHKVCLRRYRQQLLSSTALPATSREFPLTTGDVQRPADLPTAVVTSSCDKLNSISLAAVPAAI